MGNKQKHKQNQESKQSNTKKPKLKKGYGDDQNYTKWDQNTPKHS